MGLSEYEGVEFEDEKYIPEATVTEKGGIYGWLLAKGIVKNQKQGNVLIIILLLLVAGVAFSFWQLASSNQSNAPVLEPEDSWRAGNPGEIDNTIR